MIQVNIPNHTLFGCRVVNLNESKTATFDMNISFCNDGPYAVSEVSVLKCEFCLLCCNDTF